MSPLIFFPIPKDGESAMSLIYRCAIGNGISTNQFLLDAHNHQRNSMISVLWKAHAACNLLTSHSSFEPHEKASIQACFFTPSGPSSRSGINVAGVSFAPSVVRTDLALCPGCAREGFLNQMHAFNFSDVCPVHGELYIEKCPECKNKLEWRSINNYFCPCGFDLRLTPTVLANNHTSQLLSTALNNKDTQFFTTFIAAMTAMSFAHTCDNRSFILESCTKIATGNKTFFFRELEKLQDRFPSLHRRALLAPFLLSANPTLSQYAKEYYFSACQTRPVSHAANCQCGELVFESEEIKLIFGSNENVMALRNEHRCVYSSSRRTIRKTFQCPELCKTLYSHKDILWERDDTPAEPLHEFELLNHIAAAELLGTTPKTVRRLISSGLLKGAKLDNSSRIATTLGEVNKFNDNYALKSEIIRKSGFSNNELRTLLLNLAPIAIRTTRYARKLLVYQRKHLPEDLRQRLDRRNMNILKHLPYSSGLITFNIASERLRMPVKDVAELVRLGILKTAPGPIRRGRSHREYCTEEGMRNALIWREKHLSVSEVDEATGCDSRIIHSRFINTGYIECIWLERAYITLDDAKKINEHYRNYITTTSLYTKFRVSKSVVSGLIDAKKITPLPLCHPDSINGHTVLRLDEVNNILTEHRKSQRKISTQPKTTKPLRRIYSHYLTTPATLQSIAQSIGIESSITRK
ncbi:TniQ family protein [Pseudomonas vancouverensis]|uniref:TniQ domain-containing protein n=1 Tax=Pseudomonas vancouverensis TaxID=95300 RepID=A0A1H2NYD4_PSEVA|nr:TniQ family protein [Pseudomonas vancouverensis]KAB0496573.1 hypothetical protein F7R09_12560 [Pseudomonas vancouverensis]TDB64719.1 hypothetical protein EIY72_09875 [Pseudomonas vancouverensis]SDV10467.1 TniQ protein [Pseudomonas vancouverensis]